MPNGDDPAWTVTARALDHHDTVAALDRAVAGQLGEALAEDVAAGLARAGIVLVPMDGGAALAHDLTVQVDAHLAEEAATSWFGRRED
jgi:molybdopterin biosynthesis enzyme